MELATILHQHTRSQCATAAMSRLEHAPMNLLGLYDSETPTRRRRCHEAPPLRLLMPPEAAPEVHRSTPTHKRRSDDDTQLVQNMRMQLSGGDAWSPFVRGLGHRMKRHASAIYTRAWGMACHGV